VAVGEVPQATAASVIASAEVEVTDKTEPYLAEVTALIWV